MTKREMYANIATLLADNAEVVEFCNHEIELLSNRKGSHSLTKTQKENVGIMETIKVALADVGSPITVTDLIASNEALNGFTNQKVSALLRKLVDNGSVVKTIEGKKAYFSIT